MARGVVRLRDIADKTGFSTNTVSLAPYTRLDAALFYKINEMFTAQINIENIFDTDYFEFANSNTNITPAAPRLIKVSLTTSL